jgi:hypothetical protein
MYKKDSIQGHWAVKLVRRDLNHEPETVWVEYYSDETQARNRAKSVTDYSNLDCYYVGEISWSIRAKKQHS